MTIEKSLPETTRMVGLAHGLQNSFHDRMLAKGTFVSDVMESRVQVILFAVNFSAHVVEGFSPVKEIVSRFYD